MVVSVDALSGHSDLLLDVGIPYSVASRFGLFAVEMARRGMEVEISREEEAKGTDRRLAREEVIGAILDSGCCWRKNEKIQTPRFLRF